jgi:uncharacterized protein (UPF0264 family)
VVKQTCMEALAFDIRFDGSLESYVEDSHRHGVDIALETDHYKQHVVVVDSIVAVVGIDVYAVRDGVR